MPIAYTVTASFPTHALREEYIRWLEDGHVDAVIAGGAISGTIIRLDSDQPTDPPRAEVRYLFPTRQALERYVREHAPALRADGLRRFPPQSGVVLTRTIGEVLSPRG